MGWGGEYCGVEVQEMAKDKRACQELVEGLFRR